MIAIDGKTVRGARRRDRGAPHLVAALDQASGTVLGQLAVAAKSNEIPAVRTLLAGFDLAEVVVTVDAMHTQHDTALVRRRWRSVDRSPIPAAKSVPANLSRPHGSPPLQ